MKLIQLYNGNKRMDAKKIIKDSIKILLMGIVAFVLLVILGGLLGAFLSSIEEDGGYVVRHWQ